MEIKINALIQNRNHFQWCEVFGYTSKGQPGIEVIGLGTRGRAIKEKLTFLSKRRKLTFPVLRFVICVEGDNLEKANTEFLELPILLAFWSMANTIPIKRLDQCFCNGKVSLEGEVTYLELSHQIWQQLEKSLIKNKKEVIYLGNEIPADITCVNLIKAHQLLAETVGGFYIQNEEKVKTSLYQ
jgi:predicted ATPase with chaperone activity